MALCFYYLIIFLLRILLRLTTRWQVNGKENVPHQGPLLVVANHISAVDPPLLSVSLSRRVIFMAKAELFHPRIIGYFVRSLGAFPVHRRGLDTRALRLASQLLAQGLAIVMFPEGTRSHSGRLRRALPGSALVVARSATPILPVGITGTEKMRGIAWLLRRPRVTVNVGHPFSLPVINSRLTKAELTGHTDVIMSHIAELLPESQRGDYGNEN